MYDAKPLIYVLIYVDKITVLYIFTEQNFL
jgi:hypothetical protein